MFVLIPLALLQLFPVISEFVEQVINDVSLKDLDTQWIRELLRVPFDLHVERENRGISADKLIKQRPINYIIFAIRALFSTIENIGKRFLREKLLENSYKSLKLWLLYIKTSKKNKTDISVFHFLEKIKAESILLLKCTHWLSCSSMIEAFMTSFLTTGPIRIPEYYDQKQKYRYRRKNC